MKTTFLTSFIPIQSRFVQLNTDEAGRGETLERNNKSVQTETEKVISVGSLDSDLATDQGKTDNLITSTTKKDGPGETSADENNLVKSLGSPGIGLVTVGNM